MRARITAAHFPTIKTIESFDFALQPELPKAKLLEHFDGAFVDAHRNVIFSGPPGVGKSHILSALGLAMCMRGYRVLFTTAAALLMKLIAAKRTATLERHYRNLDRIDLLLIDELGYVPFEREATDLLFQLISQRYERRSIALHDELALREVDPGLSRRDDRNRRHRPTRPSRRCLRVRRPKPPLPNTREILQERLTAPGVQFPAAATGSNLPRRFPRRTFSPCEHSESRVTASRRPSSSAGTDTP